MADRRTQIILDDLTIPLYSVNTLIIGSGAAGLNAAVQLHGRGQTDILLVTERLGAGTSYNAGSDKQTYYKLSLAGKAPDSPMGMAQDLFHGGCMHGDVALCEAQHSAQAFYHLVGLGVPFPHDRYGGYPGYRTDHDTAGRATSAGPLTSRFMCEALAKAVREKGIEVLDHHEVVALLWDGDEKSGRRIRGALAMDRNRMEDGTLGLVLLNAQNVILATGGPGGMYRHSVYPESQTGSMGMALEAGAAAHNLTESQFGLASIGFRWNVSGSYQQVIPSYISTAQDGSDEKEFLHDYFPDPGLQAAAIFRKGYEWPFDAARIADHGSSLIDLAVFEETVKKGRRVFLDFRQPGTLEKRGTGKRGTGTLFFEEKREPVPLFLKEAHDYLARSNALLPTPIERLAAMNPQAIELFKSHGIDLARDRLEIAVCAQHNNGGLKGNLWWETTVARLFAVGEVNGTHGVRRPGGSALNAGQAGSLRAALYIAAQCRDTPLAPNDFLGRTSPRIRETLAWARAVSGQAGAKALSPTQGIEDLQQRMSAHGAHIRNPATIHQAVKEAWALHDRMKTDLRVPSLKALPGAFRIMDLCLAHAVYLEALAAYLDEGGKSRGSFLVLDPAGQSPSDQLGPEWRFSLAAAEDKVNQKILEIELDPAGKVQKRWVDIRPVPDEDEWFETVWKDFTEGRVIRE